MKLGDRISKRRKEIGISQERLAEIMNVSRQSVSLWENNQTIPSMEKLLQLSAVLNVTVNFLVGNEQIAEDDALPIVKAKTIIKMEYINEAIKLTLKKSKTRIIVLSTVLGISILGVLTNDDPTKYVLISFVVLFECVVVYRYFNSKKRIKDSAVKELNRDPQKEFSYDFFYDHVITRIKSPKIESKITLTYEEIGKVIETGNYYYLVVNESYYPVSKVSLQGNVDVFKNLLRNNIAQFESSIEKIENKTSNMSLKKRETLKTLSMVLFVLSFFTLPLAMLVIQLYLQTIPFLTSTTMLESLWLMLVVFPLPASSVIVGIIMKKNAMKGTKNIVIGVIMGILVLIYSSFPLIFGSMFSHDYSYVDNLEKSVKFEFPDHGKISTHNFEDTTFFMGVSTEYESEVLFTDDEEIAIFENEVNDSNLWTTSISAQNMGMLSTSASFSLSSYDHFMIYNIGLGTYNVLPASSGNYHLLFLTYDSKENKMKIYKYAIKLTIN